jgi:hypothetical protein
MNLTFMWPYIVRNFFIIKPTRCTNFTNLFWHETLHVSDSSSAHHQEFIHCALSNAIYVIQVCRQQHMLLLESLFPAHFLTFLVILSSSSTERPCITPISLTATKSYLQDEKCNEITFPLRAIERRAERRRQTGGSLPPPRLRISLITESH